MSCAYFCNMKLLQTKTKLVFVPLLVLTFAFFVTYLLLYWFICIRLGNEFFKEDITHIWCPMALAAILVLLFIRPRVHLLKLDKDNGRIRGLYYMVAIAVLCVPTVTGVYLLDTATGKLTDLGHISEIQTRPQSRYYKPNAYVLFKSHIGVHPKWTYSGKRSQNLNFEINIAMPFGDHLFDTLVSPPAFLYFRYQDQVSSKLSAAAKDEAWKKFWKESMADFENGKQGAFTYLERMGNSDSRDDAISAARKSDRYLDGAPVTILEPAYEPFESRNGNKPKSLMISFFAGFTVWWIMVLIPGLHLAKAKRFSKSNNYSAQKQVSRWINAVVNEKALRLTHSLIAINTVVFLVIVLMGGNIMSIDSDILLNHGALYKPFIQNGDWWRFTTSIFLHGNIMHLVMNMVGLYLCGLFVEPVLGWKKMLLLYGASGILASFVSLWWHQTPVVAVGASGAIFGLYGFILAMVIWGTGSRSFNRFLAILLASTAGFSLVMGFVSEGIDNAAHVGGLIAGFLIGLPIFIRQRKNEEEAAEVF